MRLTGFIVLAAIVLSTGFAALAAPVPGSEARIRALDSTAPYPIVSDPPVPHRILPAGAL